MLDSFSTNATVAKARAIYGKRLTREDYKELLHRSSVTEVAEYLKRNTHYKNVLSAIDTNNIHRGFLENLLKRDNFDLYVRLCKFQQLDKIPFYNYIVVKQEIEEIVSCVLHLNAKASDEYIETLPSFLISHASFDLLALAKCRDFSEMLKVLKKTPYYAILKDMTPDENGTYDCTMIEAKLYTNYLKWFKDVTDKSFSGKTASNLDYLTKTQVDLMNLISGFRLKAFSNADAATIEQYMLPFYGRISRNNEHEIFEATDPDDYIKRLQKTYYGRQMQMFDESLDNSMLENYTHALRAKYAKIALRASSSAPVSLYTIVFLFDIEVENLINILEGIRYKAPLQFIEKLLII